MTDDELRSDEKKALESLPKERMPRASLEHKVVRALHHQGMLRHPKRRIVEVTGFRLASAVAACALLVVVGFALGRWTGTHGTPHPLSTPVIQLEMGDISVAASLQRAGTEYVNALELFAALQDSTRMDEMQQGREVALNTLYTAAGQVTKIVPKNYLARQLLQVIDFSEGSIAINKDGAEDQPVVWF
jgi:hypothetical protein